MKYILREFGSMKGIRRYEENQQIKDYEGNQEIHNQEKEKKKYICKELQKICKLTKNLECIKPLEQ